MTLEYGLLMFALGMFAIFIASVIIFIVINLIEKKRTEVNGDKHLDKF
jgi:hypothetical protein|tara:strand:- start:22 stop:165 length:144 start_codon:yes stop_codon:yes gene_type:complete